MAGESLSFDITGHDRASGSFRSAAAAAADMGGKMDLAAKSAYVLQESLNKQRKAADASVGATLSLAKADKILDEVERRLADGALEAEYALKKEAEAAKKSGRAAVEAAAENRTLADSLRKVGDSSFFKPSGLGIAAALSPALIPLAGGIAAGVGAIGISFGAAAIGAGLFGLAAKSVLTQASSDAQKLSALNAKLATAQTAAQKKAAQQAIAALTAGWAKGYQQLIGQYQDFHQKWKAASQAIAVPALTTWLGALSKGLPLLVTAVKPVANVFQAWGDILRKNFADPAVMKNLQGMAAAFGKFSAQQLALIGGSIEDFALGVFHLGKDLAGSGANFSAFGFWLNNIGSGFLTWSKSKQARDDVQGFLGYVHKNGGLVTGILQDLGKILPGILQGVSGTGQLELQAISGLLGGIAKLPQGWQKPLTEAAGALLLLSKTGVISTGLKIALPKEGAGKTALAASLGMRLVAGAFIVPAAVMIIGTIIPKDTSKQAAADFKNQPGIVVKVSDFLHTEGLGAWVDQYFSHPIRKWALTTLPDTLDTAASKIGVFLTRTIPIDALKMVVSVTGILDKLPGPFQSAFRKAHDSAASELSKLQFKAAHTFSEIQSGINAFHGKKVALTFSLNLPAGVSYPSRHIKGRAAGWRVPGSGSGDTVPAMLTPGEAVVPKRLVPAVAPFLSANRVPGFASGGLAGPTFAGTFPSASTIRGDDAAMQQAVSAIAALVKGLLHINKSSFLFSGPTGGSTGPGAAAAQSWMRAHLGDYGWGAAQWPSLVALWNGESGWRWNAQNPTSPAYGIPQSDPGSKMAAAGADWRTNPVTQMRWGAEYIRGTYGNPSTAYSDWLGRSPHWYGNGLDAVFSKRTLIGVGERGPERVQVTPRGRGGEVRHVLEIRSGGSRMDDLIVDIIRHAVSKNGGDVQVALGEK